MSGNLPALVNPRLIKDVRKIANRALQTQVSIYRRGAPAENAYGQDDVTWTFVETVWAWLKTTNTPVLSDVGAVIGAIAVYRLHCDADVLIQEGDEVHLGDLVMVASDVNTEDTYRVFTTATLRRRQ